MSDTIPLNSEFIITNAGQRCDALIGHCACGATHGIEDLQPRFLALCSAQQEALTTYIAKLDATQCERDAARAERDALKSKVPANMAEACYAEEQWTDRLFTEVNRIMGGKPLDECADKDYKWACVDCWVDPYDASVEIIRGIDWPELTKEQAMAILDLGFGQIYESPANADTTSRDGFLWTRKGRGWCIPKNRGDGNVRMVKAIHERDTLRAELSAAQRERDAACAAIVDLGALKAEVERLRANDAALRAIMDDYRAVKIDNGEALFRIAEALATDSPGEALLEAVRKAHEALGVAVRIYAECMAEPDDDQCREALAALAPFVAAKVWCAMCGKMTDHQSGACPELKG